MRRPFVLPMLMLMFVATLAACAAPTPGSDAIAPQAAPQTTQEAAAPAAATPAAPARNAPDPISSQPVPPAQRPPRSKPAPPMSDPLPAQRMPEPGAGAGAKPGKVDGSCKVDADCTVKNVGNCCGYYPACVNVNSPTDPKGVQAQCAKSGMASVCGFQEISGCQCVQGQCQASSGAVAQ